MLYLIIGLFAVAAVIGLVLATAIFNKKPSTPKGAVVAHGLLAATGLVLFLVYAINNSTNYPQLSLILFIVAALGGFGLLYNDLVRKKPGPFSVVVIHALAAVVAFVVLLAFALF